MLGIYPNLRQKMKLRSISNGELVFVFSLKRGINRNRKFIVGWVVCVGIDEHISDVDISLQNFFLDKLSTLMETNLATDIVEIVHRHSRSV